MTKETYLRSVDILLDAYNSENLFHGECNKCAVGNLLQTDKWTEDFLTLPNGHQRTYDLQPYEYFLEIYKQKGFTRQELMRIEYAFEYSIFNTEEGYDFYVLHENMKKGQFIGLSAVLKVMSEMVEEEKIDNEVAQIRLNKIANEKYHLSI